MKHKKLGKGIENPSTQRYQDILDDYLELKKEYSKLRTTIDDISFVHGTFMHTDPHPLPGLDIYGEVIPYENLPGDGLIFINFKEEFDLESLIAEAKKEGRHAVAKNLEQNHNRMGIWISDVTGHGPVAAEVNHGLAWALWQGLQDDLTHYGHFTSEILENTNSVLYQRFNSKQIEEYRSHSRMYSDMAYVEVQYNPGKHPSLRGVFAGINDPIIYSHDDGAIQTMPANYFKRAEPMGVFPSLKNSKKNKHKTPVEHFKDPYKNNTFELLNYHDDIILATDGFFDQAEGELNYVRDRLESALKRAQGMSAKEAWKLIRDDLFDYTDNGKLIDDDITFVVITRTG